MYLCYVDESGDARPLSHAAAAICPVCVIIGVVVAQGDIKNLTDEFLTLKRTTHPNLPVSSRRTRLAWVLPEIKGADIRRSLRTGSQRRNRRHAIHFLDHFVAMLEDFRVRIVGRVWIKAIGSPCDGAALFGSSMQAICGYFNRYLTECDSTGFVIADSRTPTDNAAVSHSVFTQKFKADGDTYARVLEMPTFGHSQNHVGLQIADLIGSALLFPMATYRYCTGHVNNIHVDPGFGQLVERYGPKLGALQYRYDDGGRIRGGITVDDRLGRRSGGRLFRP